MRKTIGRWKATFCYNPKQFELLDGFYMPKTVFSKIVLEQNKGIRQALDNTLNYGKCNTIERFGILWLNITKPMRTENSGFFIVSKADTSMTVPYSIELEFEKDFISDGCWGKENCDIDIRVSRQKANKENYNEVIA